MTEIKFVLFSEERVQAQFCVEWSSFRVSFRPGHWALIGPDQPVNQCLSSQPLLLFTSCFLFDFVYLWSCWSALRGLFSSATGRSRCSSRSPRASERFSAELPPGSATFLPAGRNRRKPSAWRRFSLLQEWRWTPPHPQAVLRLRTDLFRTKAAGWRVSPCWSCPPDSCRVRTSPPQPCLLPHPWFTAAVHTGQRSSINTMTHSAVKSDNKHNKKNI